MAVVKNIDVALRANVTKFEEGMKKGVKALGNFVNSIPGLGSLTGAFTSLGGAAAVAGAAIAGVGAALKHAMAETDRVGDISTELGIDPNKLLALEHAAFSVGVSADKLQMGLQKLTIASAKAEAGNKELQATFTKLKINFHDIAEATPDEKMKILAEAMAHVTSASERARLAVELFGKGGISLLQVLEQGAKGIEAATERTRFFGNVVNTKGIKAVTSWEKAWADIKLTIDGTSQQLLKLFGPALETTASGISKASEFFAELREIIFGIGTASVQAEQGIKKLAKVQFTEQDRFVQQGEKLRMADALQKEAAATARFADFMKLARQDAAGLLKTIEPIKTPLEAFLEKTKRIHQLHALDLVTLEQRNALLHRASADFSAPGIKRMAEIRAALTEAAAKVKADVQLREPVGGPAAITRGTQEAFSAFQQNKDSRDALKEQLALQKKMEAHLAKIARDKVMLAFAPLK